MTDPELVAKKLAFIETCVRELRTLARPERIADDLREERFVEHTLQLAIQAALDVGSHIVSDERLGTGPRGVPRDDKENGGSLAAPPVNERQVVRIRTRTWPRSGDGERRPCTQ
jgi:uncharacterized protein YutE (UPF0331/DUF86 family)